MNKETIADILAITRGYLGLVTAWCIYLGGYLK